jgi:hypothetical protein
MEPKKRFQGINSASLFSLAGRFDNPIPTRFLAPIDCLKIQAQLNNLTIISPFAGTGSILPNPFLSLQLSLTVSTCYTERGKTQRNIRGNAEMPAERSRARANEDDSKKAWAYSNFIPSVRSPSSFFICSVLLFLFIGAEF